MTCLELYINNADKQPEPGLTESTMTDLLPFKAYIFFLAKPVARYEWISSITPKAIVNQLSSS